MRFKHFFEKWDENHLRIKNKSVVVEGDVLGAEFYEKFEFGDGAFEAAGDKFLINFRDGTVGAVEGAALGKFEYAGIEFGIKFPKGRLG